MEKKLVITGGHFTPAMAVVENLSAKWQVNFIGRKYSFEKDRVYSLEYKILKAKGIPFYDLEAPRFERDNFMNPLVLGWRFLRAVGQAVKYLRLIRPRLILSFGGYLALPVCLAGWFLRIPIFTHEQTLAPGLANQIIAFFARKTFVAWPESLTSFPRFLEKRLVLVGNPLRQAINRQPLKKPLSAAIPKTIYITGGSTGSHVINGAVYGCLEELLRQFKVIHQCGDSRYNDYDRLFNKAKLLPEDLGRNYSLQKHLNLEESAQALVKADIIVGRAGANTVAEVAILGKVALFIPLAFSAASEQVKNARKLVTAGSAVLLEEKDLNSPSLLEAIAGICGHYSEYQNRAFLYAKTAEIKAHRQAASLVAHCLDTY